MIGTKYSIFNMSADLVPSDDVMKEKEKKEEKEKEKENLVKDEESEDDDSDSDSEEDVGEEMKMVLVVRNDLGMTKGKMCSQVSLVFNFFFGFFIVTFCFSYIQSHISQPLQHIFQSANLSKSKGNQKIFTSFKFTSAPF